MDKKRKYGGNELAIATPSENNAEPSVFFSKNELLDELFTQILLKRQKKI